MDALANAARAGSANSSATTVGSGEDVNSDAQYPAGQVTSQRPMERWGGGDTDDRRSATPFLRCGDRRRRCRGAGGDARTARSCGRPGGGNAGFPHRSVHLRSGIGRCALWEIGGQAVRPVSHRQRPGCAVGGRRGGGCGAGSQARDPCGRQPACLPRALDRLRRGRARGDTGRRYVSRAGGCRFRADPAGRGCRRERRPAAVRDAGQPGLDTAAVRTLPTHMSLSGRARLRPPLRQRQPATYSAPDRPGHAGSGPA